MGGGAAGGRWDGAVVRGAGGEMGGGEGTELSTPSTTKGSTQKINEELRQDQLSCHQGRDIWIKTILSPVSMARPRLGFVDTARGWAAKLNRSQKIFSKNHFFSQRQIPSRENGQPCGHSCATGAGNFAASPLTAMSTSTKSINAPL